MALARIIQGSAVSAPQQADGMKRRKSDSVVARKTAKPASVNPFEVRVNRKKHDILGQKTKSDRGLPGISRSKAVKKRKQTLLKEYRESHKSNRFLDHRIGEYDADMTPEDRMVQRFMRERKHKVEKASLFSLEEEDLTHYGQSLAEVDDLGHLDVLSGSDEEGGEDVGESHFGGFVKKSPQDEGAGNEEQKRKTHSEIMKEVVAQSKAAKFQRQEVKREVEDLLEEVDSQWRVVQSLVVRDGNEPSKEPCLKTTDNDYDRMVKELAFAPRGKPTDRLKSEEEIAREEKEMLEALEAERVQRMRSGSRAVSDSDSRLMSADQLTTSVVEKRDDRVMLSYHDGSATIDLFAEEGGRSKVPFPTDSAVQKCEDGGGASGGEEGLTGDEEVVGNPENDAENESDSDSEVVDDGDSGDSDSDSDSDAAGQFGSDLESSDEDRVVAKNDSHLDGNLLEEHPAAKVAPSLTTPHIPYTFEVPESVADLQKLLSDRIPSECDIIVSRIHKCHHQSLSHVNRTKLEAFFVTLVDYVLEMCDHPSPRVLATINSLTQHIYDLGHLNPSRTLEYFQQHLQDTADHLQQRRARHAFLSFSELMVFKLVGLLFPTSDYRHPVSTPARCLLGHTLSQCGLESASDCVKSLFACQLLMEYESVSRRFVPEVVSCLTSILGAAASSTAKEAVLLPPYKASKMAAFLTKSDLSMWQDHDCGSLVQMVASMDNGERRLYTPAVVSATVALAKQALGLWSNLPAAAEVFAPLLKNVSMIASSPEGPPSSSHMAREVEGLRKELEVVCSKPKGALRMLQQKPKSITFHEPRFDEAFVVGRKRARSKADAERKKLLHKVKRERKGAIRELRKDSTFLAKEKLKDQLEKDAERQKKVKELLGSLANQQAQLKAEKRAKR